MLTAAHAAFMELNPDHVEILPYGLFFKKRSKSPSQLFLGGHLDTVFPKGHPFQAATRLDENTLQGPGVLDMKGGILVMLSALLRFEQSNMAENIGWEIVLNLDEEIGSPYSTPFLQACAKRCDVALLFEPPLPDKALVSGRKSSSNYIGRSFGKAAHAGRHPEHGKSAIYPLAKFIAAIENLPFVNVGVIEGGEALNIIPHHASAHINVRGEEAIAPLEAAAKEFGIKLERTSYRPPKPFDAKTEELFNLLKSCSKKPLTWRETGGVCDGNTFGAAGVPTIDTLGVEGSGAHTEHEQIHLPSLEEKAELTFNLLEALARKTHG